MTLYMLDTNIVSDLMRNPAGKVAGHIASVGEDKLCLSIVTAAELRYGAAKSGSSRLLARVEAISILPLSVPADAHCGGLRAELEAAGRPIGPNDLLIAAHAQVHGATLVTANVSEFRRVRGLEVEDWIADPRASETS